MSVCRKLLCLALVALCPGVVQASTAQPVVPGYWTTTSCPGGITPCFVQYGNGLTPVNSGSAEANHVLKNAAGSLYYLSVTSGASAGYVMIFNATSAPADGAVTPVFCQQIAANSNLVINPETVPMAFGTGVTASFSTTGCFTKTASSTAFFSALVQ